jgi:hypothetical protein
MIDHLPCIGIKNHADRVVGRDRRNGDGQYDPPEPNAGFTAIAAGVNYSLALRGGGPVPVLYEPTSVTEPVWHHRTELRLASPSPFRRQTALNFTLATPSRVRLSVYDVAGRLVRVLVERRDSGRIRQDRPSAWGDSPIGSTTGSVQPCGLTVGGIHRCESR